MLLFFIVLPLINARLDWMSWAASRFFIQAAVDKKTLRPGYVLWHLALDIVLAIIFLILLAMLLPIILQILNISLNITMPGIFVDWMPLLQAAKEYPFTQGLAVTGMLFTTLIPTVLHVSIGLIVVMIPVTFNRFRKHTVDNLHLSDDLFTDGKCALASLYLCVTFFVGLVSVIGCFIILIMIINYWANIQLLSSMGNALYDLAIWSANLVGGPGLPNGDN